MTWLSHIYYRFATKSGNVFISAKKYKETNKALAKILREEFGTVQTDEKGLISKELFQGLLYCKAKEFDKVFAAHHTPYPEEVEAIKQAFFFQCGDFMFQQYPL